MLKPKNERSYSWESVPGVDNVQETNSETGQMLNNKNKRVLLLMKAGVKWVYHGLKKDKTLPQC